MTNKTTNLAVAKNGDKFMAAMHQQDSDAPILPVKDILTLKDASPEAVRLILEETEKEAEYRRKLSMKEQDRYYFMQYLGQFFALIIGLAGVAGGVCCVWLDHPKAGGTIASLAIVSLALAFIDKNENKK